MNEVSTDIPLHRARCSCGQLGIEVSGRPQRVNACSCIDCQRRSGSAFSYTAFFPDSAVRQRHGEVKIYREMRDAGRWHDSYFCPRCGVTVYCVLEAIPGHVGIAVGTLSEPDFAAPEHFYWTIRRPHWLVLPADLDQLERQ